MAELRKETTSFLRDRSRKGGASERTDMDRHTNCIEGIIKRPFRSACDTSRSQKQRWRISRRPSLDASHRVEEKSIFNVYRKSQCSKSLISMLFAFLQIKTFHSWFHSGSRASLWMADSCLHIWVALDHFGTLISSHHVQAF